MKTRSLLLVWAALLGLLLLTLGASLVLTGPASLLTSLAVALAKAALIFWFFMHLKEETGLLRLVAVGAGVWLLILLALTFADYATRAAA
ncbi:MAG: cytochrome C oxidase subunit IV family protein [Parvibaculaceae bacterium]